MVQSEQHRAELIQLAEVLTHGRDERQSEIYLAITALFHRHNHDFTARERGLAADILRRLSKDVEMSIRIALAMRVAELPDVPREIILMLADDRIEVAKPILMRSLLLGDEDLVRVVDSATDDHRIAVAERPAIGMPVTAALARSDCEAAIIALLRNKTAAIGSDTFEQLVERARDAKDLQEPLANRADLPGALASRMYEWVSAALQQALARRYPSIAPVIAAAVEETKSDLQAVVLSAAEIAASKLIAKLAAAGDLKASFLIRTLHQGQIDLFEYGFASLLKMDVPAMRRALYEQPAATVALACRAVGIDRSVFMTVFSISRRLRGRSAALSDVDHRQIDAVFTGIPKIDALDRLKRMAA